tara:strand:+ start:2871 stop:3281 length:411 start_codon:yes stop_codon:yes gene_type:complete
MQKKGISAVVATVLIILIVVAGVAILWGAIIPMLQEETSFQNELVDLSIETAGGYTFWDGAESVSCVQVSRGNDKVVVEKIEVIFEKEGDSEKAYFETGEVLGANQKKTKCFYLAGFGEPDSVKVAPVFEGGRWVV